MRGFDVGRSYLRQEDGSWLIDGGGVAALRAQTLQQWGAELKSSVLLVASGPSARDYDWRNIGDSSIVAVNGSTGFLRGLGLKPDLWVTSDPDFNRTGTEHFLQNPDLPLALTHRGLEALLDSHPETVLNRPMCLIERVNQWYGTASRTQLELEQINQEGGQPFVFPEGNSEKLKIGWSHRPEWGFFSGCTVVFAALQILVRLGARDIQIIGMDLGGAERNYTEQRTRRPSELEAQRDSVILPAFSVMSKALAKSGVRIRNLSPVCPIQGDLVPGGD
ncbi:hypothetical protein Rhal01_01654 [Rubritalea halochordaticola]|uniref:DUF115 domain-containing protein n=1 Tax=Rubritalea halochordaticola TaxID=714537 RepID=A0ABP9UYE3_9BACT